MLRAIIVDDEPNSSSALKEKIAQHFFNVIVLKICNNAKEGIDAIDSLQPDLVFLDIEMPLMNGFVMLQQLTYKKFELVFTTAYDHYAIRAIRFSALDYLVKPIEIEELRSAIDRAEEKKHQNKPNQQLELLLENLVDKKHLLRIAIPTTGGLQFIKVGDIIYLEASVNYTHIFLTEKRKFTVSRTLKDFEEMLPPEEFLRIHNSFIINKNCVEKYIRGEGGQVVLTNNAVLEVSKRKKSDFLKAIGY
ncbi:MAG: LytTR family DNA-binding domain-containing protein [Bacteroidota bacterium]